MIHLESFINLLHPMFRQPVLQFFQNPLIRDRFTRMPASTMISRHQAYDGGLLDHTVDVLQLALATARATAQASRSDGRFHFQNTQGDTCSFPQDHLILAALFHDLHKIGDLKGQDGYVPNMNKGRGKNPVPTRSVAKPYARNKELRQELRVNESHSEASYILKHVLENECIDDGILSLAMLYELDPNLYRLLPPEVVSAIEFHAGMYSLGRRRIEEHQKPLLLTLHYADMLSSRIQPDLILENATEDVG